MIPDNPVARALAVPARWCAILGGWWLLGLALLTCVEILARKAFAYSLQGVDEIGAYTLAAFATLSFTWALVIKAHSRVDFLLAHLPAGLRAGLNALAYALLAALSVFAAWRGWHVLAESIEFQSHANSPLNTPMWLPQTAWLAGLVVFAAAAAAFGLHALWLLLVDRPRLNRLYGPLTTAEEVEAEAGAILARSPRA